MALGTLIEKLKSKKQAAVRSAFGVYLEAVKSLANGVEHDSDEIDHILQASGRDEDTLVADVKTRQEWLTQYSLFEMHKKSELDRRAAEADLSAAQLKMQAAIAKIRPEVDAAANRLSSANTTHLATMGAEAWLTDPSHILDVELLYREQSVSKKLMEINIELRPLLKDLEHKRHSLGNREFNLAQKQGRNGKAWEAFGGMVPYFNKTTDLREAESQFADAKSQVEQLEAAVRPRQQRQRELQNELDSIHRLKLEP